MAYATGSANTIPLLFVALESFATTHGWTIDESDTVSGWPRFHKNSCYVGFRYDGTTPQATGRSMGVYQSKTFDPSPARPGSAASGDSGSGADDQVTTITDATIDNSRCVYTIGDGPFNYWFFEHDDGTVYYIHVVLEVRAGEYRHFGFGKITKFGDWGVGASGGEYCYGLRNESGCTSGDSSYFFEAGNSVVNVESVDSAATMLVNGLPGQQASDWGTFLAYTQQTVYAGSLDRAGLQRNRFLSNARGGPQWRAQGWFKGYPGFTGLIPLTALTVFYFDLTNARTYVLGEMPDVKMCNIAQFDAAEEVTIGSETYVFFPFTKKGTVGGSTSTSDSYFYGVAYRKEVT